MNESILIQKMIQIGVNLNSNVLEYSGAEADAKNLLDEIKQQCNIDSVSESSWTYYEKELDKIEQLNQTQSSLHKQMFILRHFANKLGLYDVADYLKR